MRGRFLLPVLLLGLAWAQEVFDQVLFSGNWNLPMGPGLPWWGVLSAPFSHSGFGHLLSNSVIFLVLSWLVLTRGVRGLPVCLGGSSGDECTNRAVMAHPKPWTLWRDLWAARLSLSDWLD